MADALTRLRPRGRQDAGREQLLEGKASSETALLSRPNRIAVLDYAAGTAGNVTASLSFTTTRAGVLHGLYVWFDTVLVDEIGFSNAPGLAGSIYGRAFFPLTEEVHVSEGEHVPVDFGAGLVAGDYVYRWNVRIWPAKSPTARFRQSTFLGMPLSARTLRASDESHVPSLNATGGLTRRALELMDGHRTVAEIADALRIESGSSEDALELATAFSRKYGE